MGQIARASHLPAIAADPRFHLVGTIDRRADAALPGIAHATGFGELRAKVAFDALVIATPPGPRAALACQAIDAGIAVMLEKPPAASLAEVAALVRAAGDAGVPLFAAWHTQMAPAVAPARAWLRGKSVRTVAITWREDIRQWHPGQDWLLAGGGFGAFDPGINALSLLCAVIGEGLRVERADVFVPRGRGAAIRADLALRLDSGAAVAAVFDILHPGMPLWEIRIEADRGAITIGAGGHSLVVDGIESALPKVAEYSALYRRFAQVVADRAIEVDDRPLALVEQALALAQRHDAPPFDWDEARSGAGAA
eukprot:gene6445-6512_t